MAASNREAMQAGVAQWITDAQRRPDGARLLRQKAAWVERQIGELYITAKRNRRPPQHLAGLTAVDLITTQARLEDAARALDGASA